MKDFLFSFTNRDIALFIWISIFLIYMLMKKTIRSSFFGVIKALFAKKVAVVLFLMIAYVTFLIFVLYKLTFWDMVLLKDTIYWFFGTAFVMFINFNKATSEKDYFKNVVLDNIKIAVFITFVTNFYVFNLAIEFFLLPILVFIFAMIALAGTKKEFLPVKKLLNGVMSIFGIFVLIYTGVHLVNDFKDFATLENLKDFFLAPILTFAYLAFIYALAVYSTYESMFVRVSIFLREKDEEFLRSVKWKIFGVCLFNLSAVNDFSQNYANKLMSASTMDKVNTLIRQFKNRT